MRYGRAFAQPDWFAGRRAAGPPGAGPPGAGPPGHVAASA